MTTDPDGIALALIFGVIGLALLLVGALVQYVERTPRRRDDWDRVADRRRRLEHRARNVRAGIRQ